MLLTPEDKKERLSFAKTFGKRRKKYWSDTLTLDCTQTPIFLTKKHVAALAGLTIRGFWQAPGKENADMGKKRGRQLKYNTGVLAHKMVGRPTEFGAQLQGIFYFLGVVFQGFLSGGFQKGFRVVSCGFSRVFSVENRSAHHFGGQNKHLRIMGCTYMGRSKMIPYQGRFNGKSASKCFEKAQQWAASVDKKPLRSKRRIMMDNCPVLSSKMSTASLKRLRFEKIQFPRRSPDIMAWDCSLFSQWKTMLNKQMAKLAGVENKWKMDRFMGKAREAWRKMAITCGRTVRSMPDKLKRVAQNKGELID